MTQMTNCCHIGISTEFEGINNLKILYVIISKIGSKHTRFRILLKYSYISFFVCSLVLKYNFNISSHNLFDQFIIQGSKIK